MKDRFGIASTGPVTGVELRTEDLDLHDLHIDDEGMGGIVPDLKKGFAVEPDPTDSGIECFGIAQTTVAVEPDPRPVGKRELALAASGRDQAHRRGAFIPRTQEQVFPADDERQQGRCGRKTPQGYEPALLSGPVQHVDPVVYVGEFMAVIAFRRPGEQFLPGLKKRCVLRFPVGRGGHPPSETALDLLRHIAVQKIADESVDFVGLHRLGCCS